MLYKYLLNKSTFRLPLSLQYLYINDQNCACGGSAPAIDSKSRQCLRDQRADCTGHSGPLIWSISHFSDRLILQAKGTHSEVSLSTNPTVLLQRPEVCFLSQLLVTQK